MTVEDRTTGYG